MLLKQAFGDPEINTSASRNMKWQHRMQTSVPELADLSKEPQSVLDLYGINDSGRGRRLCAQLPARAADGPSVAVRFIQLMHRGWDCSTTICPNRYAVQCKDVDQKPSAACD